MIAERLSAEYKNCSQQFTEQPVDYNRQYCSIYLARLKEFEPLLLKRISSKWNDHYPICKLHKLTEENYEKCVVIGTLFKDQKLKPSVLKQLAEANNLDPQPILAHFTDESDILYMEDEVQRYHIVGNINDKKLITGITCALLGRDVGKGKFEVEDHIFAGYREQIGRPLISESIFVLFLSGLDFFNHGNIIPNLQLLYYWLTGMLGDIDSVSKLCRIIIAGNSVRTEAEKIKPSISMVSRISQSPDSMDAVKSFDQFLMQLCQLVEVDIMPGQYDPSNHVLPQKPMHHCMFPKASAYLTCNQVSNPYLCEIAGVKILGTSGQPVRDIMRFSEIIDPLEVMENCLKWNHIAPTAPDTLGCFPYYDKDPFIIVDCPHVFFSGNQDKFSYRMCKGNDGQKVCLLALPRFNETLQAALLDLKTLDCKSISFEAK
ncbi:DNA polymerase delta subunit 2 [Cylas formicarius]|uniref:DNA polymerase delta subunit 2 n=1 Tax=Cylas formicarius TaxID=197179 RepID=UPI002958A54B|nr:DNA polymerase delta subunit 2 [Cylas formicarius]